MGLFAAQQVVPTNREKPPFRPLFKMAILFLGKSRIIYASPLFSSCLFRIAVEEISIIRLSSIQ